VVSLLTLALCGGQVLYSFIGASQGGQA